MVALAALALFAIPPQRLFPGDATYKDRQGFYLAISKVHVDMPAAEARRLLGRPDDTIRDHDELGGYNADEIWCYGTDKHLGFPTLGVVCILRGKVFWSSGQPIDMSTGRPVERPYLPLMQEAELRSTLRKIGGEDRGKYDRTTWLVRTANALIDLGTAKAVFVLTECERVSKPYDGPADIGSLERVVFEVPYPPGYPQDREPDAMPTELKPAFRKDPRFPMILFEDIPYEFSLGFYVGFVGTPASYKFDYHHYRVRSNRLRPPDDPFLSCERLIASDWWPFPDHAKADERFRGPYKEQAGFALGTVLSLVSDVYQPVDYRSEWPGNGLDLEKFHQGYLKVKAHWGDRRQRYVRQDGSTLVDKPQPPSQRWAPKNFNGVHAIVTLQRAGVSTNVSAKIETTALGAGPWQPEVLRIIDAKTGKVIDWIGVVDDSTVGQERRSESSYLAGRGSKVAWGGDAGHGLTIPLGTALRVELATRNQVLQGPVLRP